MNDSTKPKGSEAIDCLYSFCYNKKSRSMFCCLIGIYRQSDLICRVKVYTAIIALDAWWQILEIKPIETVTIRSHYCDYTTNALNLSIWHESLSDTICICWCDFFLVAGNFQYVTSYQHLPKLLCIVLLICWGEDTQRGGDGSSSFRGCFTVSQKLTVTSGNVAPWLKMHSVLVQFNWISSSCTSQTLPSPKLLPLPRLYVEGLEAKPHIPSLTPFLPTSLFFSIPLVSSDRERPQLDGIVSTAAELLRFTQAHIFLSTSLKE